MQSGFSPYYPEHNSNMSMTATPNSEEVTPKRKSPPPSASKSAKKVKRVGPKETEDGDKDGGDGSAAKPKRVRTGCLTCRERHLKCDEAMPHCNNCKKSNRTCKRGVRLNFIDTWVDRPPKIVTLWGTPQWKVDFLDESREIASEYQGGIARYRHLQPPKQPHQRHQHPSLHHAVDPSLAYDFNAQNTNPNMHAQPLPPIHGILPESSSYQAQLPPVPAPDSRNPFEPHHSLSREQSMYVPQPPHSGSSHHSSYGAQSQAHESNRNSVISFQPPSSDVGLSNDEKKDYLDSADETLYMQVFIEEVGVWMDTMDPLKHFGRLLPFHALSEPMLLNAFLACGARHLTLVNSGYSEDKALHYYDTATRYLLKNLQDPNRDTVVCATTAVILNVYEIMSERALQRMNHIAGARALIKECGWSARAQGIGLACFWLNVGLEVLSCLHFNWQVAWDPDEWGVDMDLTREVHNGREEVWTHRILYIIAKICNFRATVPRSQDADPREQQRRTQMRYEEWSRLKGLVDAWNNGIPRTMQPMSFVQPNRNTSKSLFPEIWLVKRSATVARLFYHTASLLLAQVHPYYAADSAEMMEVQVRQSNTICGIVAHVKDRGVASVALRSLTHAADILTNRGEQEEVLEIFKKINRETGWRIGFVFTELKQKWGWAEQISPSEYAKTHTAAQKAKEAQEAARLSRQSVAGQSRFDFAPQQQGNGALSIGGPSPPQMPAAPKAPPTNKRPPAGIPNPLLSKADFNLPQHPYQNIYVPPNHNNYSASHPGHLFYNMATPAFHEG